MMEVISMAELQVVGSPLLPSRSRTLPVAVLSRAAAMMSLLRAGLALAHHGRGPMLL